MCGMSAHCSTRLPATYDATAHPTGVNYAASSRLSARATERDTTHIQTSDTWSRRPTPRHEAKETYCGCRPCDSEFQHTTPVQ